MALNSRAVLSSDELSVMNAYPAPMLKNGLMW